MWTNSSEVVQFSNYTFLALIPKSNTTTEMGDFWSISCVNFIYRLMVKILEDKINKVSYQLISRNHIIFIEGKLISDNTILADEMVYGFGWKKISKRCCMSIWHSQMGGYWLHAKGIWILSPTLQNYLELHTLYNYVSFSVMVEWTSLLSNNHRGVRQGDLLSLILFDMMMDTLSRHREGGKE